MYTYKASWVRVVDGDTVILNVDLGFNTFHRGSFRLSGFDAPEVRGEHKVLGEAAKETLERMLLAAGDLIVETQKPDKYGRWLATLFYKDSSGGEVNINEAMRTYLLNEGWTP